VQRGPAYYDNEMTRYNTLGKLISFNMGSGAMLDAFVMFFARSTPLSLNHCPYCHLSLNHCPYCHL